MKGGKTMCKDAAIKVLEKAKENLLDTNLIINGSVQEHYKRANQLNAEKEINLTKIDEIEAAIEKLKMK